MRRFAGVLLILSMGLAAAIRHVGSRWEVENSLLAMSLEDDTARLRILDKRSGTLWEQEDPSRRAAVDNVHVRRAKGAIRIDGDPREWDDLPHKTFVWLPWMGKDGERNCSAGAKLMWDDRMLYLYVRVRDDHLAFGGENPTRWWEADSVEFWVDSVQVGLHLAPVGKPVAVTAAGEPYAGSTVAMRLLPKEDLPGYELEVAMPLRHFPVLRHAAVGTRFSFAIGLNDADPKPGAVVKRERQSYFPSSWVHSAPATFALAVLEDAEGHAPPLSRENDRSAGALDGRVSGIRPGSEPDSLTYEVVLRRGQLHDLPIRVRLVLDAAEPFVDITLDCPTGNDTPCKVFDYPPALYPAKPTSYFVGVADYCDGRYLFVGDPYLRNHTFCRGGGDLPFVLVTDGTDGMLAIMLTPWDAAIHMQHRIDDADRLSFPGFRWQPRKGVWGQSRRGRLAFFPQGGHVAACKIYRDLAARQGLVRPFSEKEKAKPDVRKLFGAIDWWGAPGLAFVREAVAAGMTRGLLNGRPAPSQMAEIIKLGWLVGEYDNYEDIDDSPTIARAKAPVATHAVVKADGTFLTAWITRDKNMKPVHTFMKQCTGVMVDCARVILPKLLATYPYNARFIDVTTACGLRECYSPLHPATREQDQHNREKLLAYISDELGLVAGGEHGRYWDVPYLDYHEGMMGGGMYSWPAGYLRDVTRREDIGKRYLTYGINPARRVPLFELVFHDCVVDTWYWGACNDYLHRVAPEITDRKTAMNVLYGTPPMLWAGGHGLRWQIPEEREAMLTIYRNVCKLHEVVADQEMTSHAFLTADRQVQQSVFADGTTCLVNFGDTSYTAPESFSRPAGRTFSLRRNDFVVLGPRVRQWRLHSASSSSAIETFVRTETCFFADFGDRDYDLAGFSGRGRCWAFLSGPGHVRIVLAPGARTTWDPGAWKPDWKQQLRAVFQTDAAGTVTMRCRVPRNKPLRFAAPGDAARSYVVLLGEAARVPDVTLTDLTIRCDGREVNASTALAADAILDIEVTIRNMGLASAGNLKLSLHLDGVAGPVLAEETQAALPPGATRRLQARLPAAKADGARRIVALVESPTTITVSGDLRLEAKFTGPFLPDAFPHRWSFHLDIPAGDPAGMPVEIPFEPGSADPGNLRVRFGGKTSVPAQFDADPKTPSRGTLVFVVPAGVPPGPLDVAVFGSPVGSERVFPPRAGFEIAEDGSSLVFDRYRAAIVNGVLSDVAVRCPGRKDVRVLAQLILSSKETGWSREPGDVEAFSLVHRGPVRVVFRCKKRVKDRYPLEREWRFYADRFEVYTTPTNVPTTCLTRAFYAADATVTNETGAKAIMDGKGAAEDFGFRGKPRWYAAFQQSWCNACIALTPVEGITYWDDGVYRGQISLNSESRVPVEKRVYLWGTGAENDTFARQAAKAYATGVKVR